MRLRRKGGRTSASIGGEGIDILEVLLTDPGNWSDSDNATIEAHLLHSHPAILAHWKKQRAESLRDKKKGKNEKH